MLKWVEFLGKCNFCLTSVCIQFQEMINSCTQVSGIFSSIILIWNGYIELQETMILEYHILHYNFFADFISMPNLVNITVICMVFFNTFHKCMIVGLPILFYLDYHQYCYCTTKASLSLYHQDYYPTTETINVALRSLLWHLQRVSYGMSAVKSDYFYWTVLWGTSWSILEDKTWV